MIELVKLYFLSLMKDENNSLVDRAIKSILWAISRVYGLVISCKDWAYKKGIRKVHKCKLPVISVGNITLGGTGKTPLVIYIADQLMEMKKKPAILTRGYGKDEDLMLKDELADAPVYVGQDRVESASKAGKGNSKVLVLDDGFQHRRLARDLNILLLDAVNAFGNGELFPRGVLREPETAIRRADMFVLTKTDWVSLDRRNELIGHLERMVPGTPVVQTRHRASFLSDATGSSYAPDSICGTRVCLVSGIADPEYFAFMVGGLGATVASRINYADHHKYRSADIGRMYEEARHADANYIVVTKKDFVKIKDLDIGSIRQKLLVLNISIDVMKGKEELIAGLDSVFSA